MSGSTFGLPESLAPDFLSLQALIETHDKRDIPCRATSVPDVWTSEDPEDHDTAARACRRCPVLIQCRAYGLKYPKEQGVYGGLTPEQRRSAAKSKEKTS